MNFMKHGRGVLAALLPLALVSPAMAQVAGNVQTRFLVNDIDKLDRDQMAGDNAVNKTKAEAFGYFTHSDYPGWFGGFYAAHERNYSQGFENIGPNDFRENFVGGENKIQELYLGKVHAIDFGEVSAELMVGKESLRDGPKYRPKVAGRYEFANGLSLFGYATVLYQTYHGPSLSVAADREYLETEFQPGVGYKVNDQMGLFADYRLRNRTQQRALYGDLKEKEQFVEIGLWKNVGDLQTALRARAGKFSMWDTLSYRDDKRNSTIRQDRNYRLVGSLSAPLTSKLRALVDAGFLWEKYGITPAGAEQQHRAPVLAVGLRYEL